MSQKKPTFSQSAKIRLIERGETVTGLAKKIRRSRTNVSLVIHERRRIPSVEADVRKELGLDQFSPTTDTKHGHTQGTKN